MLEVASFGNSNLNIPPPGNDNARGLSDTPHTLSLLIFLSVSFFLPCVFILSVQCKGLALKKLLCCVVRDFKYNTYGLFTFLAPTKHLFPLR